MCYNSLDSLMKRKKESNLDWQQRCLGTLVFKRKDESGERISLYKSRTKDLSNELVDMSLI